MTDSGALLIWRTNQWTEQGRWIDPTSVRVLTDAPPPIGRSASPFCSETRRLRSPVRGRLPLHSCLWERLPAGEVAQRLRLALVALPGPCARSGDVRSWSNCGRSGKALSGTASGSRLDDRLPAPRLADLDPKRKNAWPFLESNSRHSRLQRLEPSTSPRLAMPERRVARVRSRSPGSEVPPHPLTSRAASRCMATTPIYVSGCARDAVQTSQTSLPAMVLI